MRSLSSVSATTRHKDRLIRRGPKLRPVGDPDLRWLWAAYEMGGWDDLITQGLSQIAFTETITDLIGSTDMDWICEAKAATGIRPVALILANYSVPQRVIDPHIDFFPWATPRNRMEVIAQFFIQVSKQYKIVGHILDKDIAFYQRLWQYRIFKKGCKIPDYYARGEDVLMIYTEGPF